jgi:hypothetical protein
MISNQKKVEEKEFIREMVIYLDQALQQGFENQENSTYGMSYWKSNDLSS